MLHNVPLMQSLFENLTRLVDRIEENELQSYFPSAYQRAKKSLAEYAEAMEQLPVASEDIEK